MPNGAAALHLVSEPPSALSRAKSTTAKLGAAPAVTEIEARIGEAVAGAALAVAYAMSVYAADGQLTDAARTVGGDSLSKLAQLRLDTLGELDFVTVAQREGRRALFRRHGATLQQLNLDTAGGEKAFSELVCMAVTIAEKVAHEEQIFLKARAN